MHLKKLCVFSGLQINVYMLFIQRQKKRSKHLVQRPGV